MLRLVIEKLKKFRFTVPSLILTNALLFFMMMASSFVKTTGLTNIPAISMGFCALVMVLTFSMIFAGYAQRKTK